MSAGAVKGMIWPLKRGDTLSHYDWHPFHHHRFLNSDFLAEVTMGGDRAGGFTAMMMWSVSIAQDPAGTLPMGEVHLASLARFKDLEAWRAHRAMALRGWEEVVVLDEATGGQARRLGHPMTLMVVEEMILRDRARKSTRSAGADRKKKERIRAKLRGMRAPKSVQDTPAALDQLLRWFSMSGLTITDENMRRACSDCLDLHLSLVPLGGNSSTETRS